MDENQIFFVGVVVSSDTATYTTTVQTFGSNRKPLLQGIPLAGVFATSLGFKECIQYSVGTPVLCYPISGSHCYILGAIPDYDKANHNFYSRAALKTSDGNFDEQNSTGYSKHSTKLGTFNNNRPTDVVDGEYVMANEFGVLLGLFQQMAMLKGSELAQVQCYLLDDLVRVISHNYEHLSALGEFKIFHDGKAICAEFGATHLSGESLGISQSNGVNNERVFEQEDEADAKDEKDYFAFSQNERIKAIERLKIFLGRLGDFVHIFLTRPDPTAIRTLDGKMEGKFDRGMFDVHVAEDGRLSVRSVTGIAIEKTNWIRVPERVFTPEDTAGDKEEDINFEDKDPFEFDNSFDYRGNPTAYFLQIRDCNAYLMDLYNYKNFEQYKKDFKISKGPTDQETNLQEIDQVDPNTKVKLSDYVLRRSGLYFMDNGGIMLKEAGGAALILEGGCVYVQPAKDFVAQPLRNFIVKAGQFTSIASKKDVDISSTEQGCRVKVKKVLHMYADEQGIILQSNAQSASEPSPDDEAYDTFGGILLKAADSGIFQYGDKIFDRATTAALYKSKKNTFESTDDVATVRSAQGVDILSDKQIQLLSQQDIYAIAEGTAMFAGSGNTLLGKKDKILPLIPHPGSMFACQYDGVVDTDAWAGIEAALTQEDPQQEMDPFQEDDKFDKVKFHFLKSDKYNLEGSKQDFIPMTIAQQDDQAFSFLSLTPWVEQEVNGTKPYPGMDKWSEFYATGEVKNLQKLDGEDIYTKDVAGLQKDAKLESKSLDEYKILE